MSGAISSHWLLKWRYSQFTLTERVIAEVTAFRLHPIFAGY
jgi:hypothetical protein